MIRKSQNYVFPEYAELTQINEKRAVVSTPTSRKDVSGDSVSVVRDILSSLRNGATPLELTEDSELDYDEVEQLLMHLLQQGIIFEQSGQFQKDIFDWISGKPQNAREQVENSTVGVISTNQNRTSPVFASIEPHIQVFRFSSMDEITKDIDLLVSVAYNERPDWHLALLEKAFTHEFNFLPGRLIGSRMRVGPLTTPYQSPCYHCFYTRLQASISESVSVHETLDGREAPRETTSGPWYLQKQLESILEREVIYSILHEKKAATAGSYISQDIDSVETVSRDVLKIPGCDTCGTN